MKKNLIRLSVLILGLLLFAGGLLGWRYYKMIWGPSVSTAQEEYSLYIKTGADYSELFEGLKQADILLDMKSFDWVARKMNYPNNIRPGRYVLKAGMDNRELVTMLRSGRQVPVKLVFNKLRTKEDFSGVISKQIEADSIELLELLNNGEALAEFGMNTDDVLTFCIPNTYELYWNTGAEKFLERMKKESDRFWGQSGRLEKAADIGLSPQEVVIVASIVEEETIREKERPTVAGLYLNRIKIRMPLQADPTIKFALRQFELKRVRDKHIEAAKDSPYSTYSIPGLPPGPICIPSINAIDAVLNAEKHKYYYMCANADMSGYHAFATTHAQHERNAALYRAALNRQRIY